MTVGELIEQLESIRETWGDEFLVVLQKDSEGNGYSPLAGVERADYVADSTYSGDVYIKGELEEDDDHVEAVVLWPVN